MCFLCRALLSSSFVAFQLEDNVAMLDTVIEVFSREEPIVAADVDKQKKLLGQEDPEPLTPKQFAQKNWVKKKQETRNNKGQEFRV